MTEAAPPAESSFLGSLIDQGRALLGSVPTVPAGTERVAIAHDRFDEEDWRETLEQSPALQEVVEDLSQTFDYTEDLAEGMFDYFLKADPEVVPQEAMLESRKPNRQITMQSKDTPQAEELRQYTKGDPYSTAMAVVGISEKLREHLTHHQELAEAAREAEKQRQEREDAAEGVQDALDGAEQADAAGPGEDGQPTQEQMDAAAALQAAMDALSQAAGAEAEASAALDTQMGQSAPATRTAVRQGIEEATEEAREAAQAMAAVGVDPGEVKYMPFEQRRQLAEALSNTRLQAMAWLIGRFRMEAKAEVARRVEHQREIFTDIELGRNLALVLGSELAKFAGPRPIRLQTMIRYAEGKLLQKRYEGSEHQGKGPIVACVDTSGSMGCNIGGVELDDERAKIEPTREAWAKAITFVLLDSARRQKRDFYAILFSSAGEQRHYDFPANGEPRITDPNGREVKVASPLPNQPELGVILDLISFMFDGGTDFEQPMTQAIRVLEDRFDTNGKPKADIAFITDDDGYVSEKFMADYLRIKAKIGFRTFGFAVGMPHVGSTLEALSDNARYLNDLGSTEEVRDVFRAV